MILKDLGEFNLINRLSKRVRLSAGVVKGIGDDAAVLRYKRDRHLLLTTDMLIEGRHFLRSSGGYLIGKKAMSVNVSDIAAMGGRPLAAVISLGVPPSLGVGFIDALYKGIREVAEKFKIDLVGGDTVRSEKIIINVALTGEVKKGNLVLRNGASPGDVIFVTGSIGGSLSGRHLSFTPRVKEALFLAENYRVHSMIDVSDGLIADLGHILRDSRVGGVIYERAIPLSRHAKDFNSAVMDGEDFELVFTVPGRDADKLLKAWPFKTRLSRIGEIRPGPRRLYLVAKNKEIQKIKPKGYAHF
ncbi:MAG: thiamine-phosphate kinase [Candidatus Omnitrophica bacterium]|nr:thiamine-phosphate kinase [Candidatus Omnitrophota bacterium]